MKWAYDLCGAEPIIKDLPAYDSADIVQGELLMLSAAAFSAGAGAGIAAISAVADTVGGTQAVDAIGIANESKDTDDSPSIATAWNTTATTGGCYVKTIINPFAVYRAEVNTADAFAIASSDSTDAFCVTGVPASAMDGAWVFFQASGGPNFGELRQVIHSATGGTMNMDNAVGATITTADTALIFSPKLMNPQLLDDTATSVSMDSAAGYACDNLRVVETYINKEGGSHGPLEILKVERHRNRKFTGASKVRFYQDLMMKDHAFGVQE